MDVVRNSEVKGFGIEFLQRHRADSGAVTGFFAALRRVLEKNCWVAC